MLSSRSNASSGTPHVTEVLQFEFDPAIYRLTAIKKAVYRFGDRCFPQLEVQPNGRVVVILAQKTGKSLPTTLQEDFCCEVLDQELREVVAEETGRVRDLILAQAFSGVSLTDSVAESADYRDDPLGIAAG